MNETAKIDVIYTNTIAKRNLEVLKTYESLLGTFSITSNFKNGNYAALNKNFVQNVYKINKFAQQILFSYVSYRLSHFLFYKKRKQINFKHFIVVQALHVSPYIIIADRSVNGWFTCWST